ncbi:MAG: MFS transporter [Candidatus Pacebacteria bacterium]|nr:MFS transporter [Candidatus Paceibacterota bacterium]
MKKKLLGRINKVAVTFIFSDFLLHTGWGLIGPIFAIFLIENIKGGNLGTVGFVAATYWFVKSVSQPFIANAFDLNKGEEDDFKFLITGMVVANLVPLGYFFSTQIHHIFLLEAIRGMAMAFVVPAWLGMFSRHINKNWYAFTWSIQSTSIGLSMAFAAAFGGVIASLLGFKVIFILVSIFGLFSTSFLFSLRNKIFLKDHETFNPVFYEE